MRSRFALLGASLLFLTSCGNPADQLDNDFAVNERQDISAEDARSETAARQGPTMNASGASSDQDANSTLNPDGLQAGTIETQIGDVSTPLFASGSEPFWTAEIAEDWIVLSRSGLPEVDAPFTGFQSEPDGSVRVSSPPLEVQLVAAPCSDPTSEGVSPYQVSIVFEGVTYSGCASLGNSPVFEETELDWSVLIPEAIDAIDLCLAQMADGTVVEALYPREEDTLGLVMRDSVGRRKECGVLADGSDITFVDSLRPGEQLPWMESDALFVRGSDIPSSCDPGRGQEIVAGEDVLGLYFQDGCAG